MVLNILPIIPTHFCKFSFNDFVYDQSLDIAFVYYFRNYFDNGQIASETIDNFGIINEHNHRNISGSGYFRFVYKGENYVLRYRIVDGKVIGELCKYNY